MNKMKMSRNKVWVYLGGVILVMLLALRIVNLDADLPNYELSKYMPLDEGYYAQDAIRIVRSEITDKQHIIDDTQIKQWTSSESCLTTVFCAISLAIFGNNYYGLRLSMVIISAMIECMVALSFLKIQSDEETGKDGLTFLLLAIMTINYGFFLGGRVVEPSLTRSLCVTALFMLYATFFRKTAYCLELLGAASVWTIVLGYASNAFAVLAGGLMILAGWIWSRRISIKPLIKYIIGCMCGYISGEIIYYVVQGRFFVLDFLKDFSNYSGGLFSFSIKSFVYNVRDYASSNIFVFCPLLLWISLIAVIWNLYFGMAKQKDIPLFLAFIAIAHFAQSAVSSDFGERKSVLILPILILNIYSFACDCDSLPQMLYNVNALKRRFVLSALGIIGLGFIVCSIIRMKRTPYSIIPAPGKPFFIAMDLLQAILIICILLFGKYGKKIWLTKLFLGSAFIILLPNIVADKALLFDYEKTYKQCMIDIGSTIGDNYVMGGFPYSVCLYNDIVPVSNSYDAYLGESYNVRAKKLLEKEEIKYFIGVYESTEVIDEWLEGTEYEWKLVKEYTHAYKYEEGPSRFDRFYLFRKEKRK